MKQKMLLVRAVSVCAFWSVLAACGSSGDSVSTNSNGEAPPSLNLSVSAAQVARGESVLITWTSNRAEFCSASGGWDGGRATSGSEAVGPILENTTFSLSCSGTTGGAVQSVDVRVGEGSVSELALDASPATIAAGGVTTLRWSLPDADNCSASGGWSGSRATIGSETVGPLNEDTTYQLICDGAQGTSVAAVTVQVADKRLRWQAPTQNADGTPLNDLAGYVIYWGESSRNYTGSYTINSPYTTQWDVPLAPGEYYFAMTAFDRENSESGYSNELRKVIP